MTVTNPKNQFLSSSERVKNGKRNKQHVLICFFVHKYLAEARPPAEHRPGDEGKKTVNSVFEVLLVPH